MTNEPSAGRRPRSDGRRNRDSLIEVARTAFLAGEFDLPLEEIARRAGVGIGTLYRHFPQRDALVEAVYTGAVEDLGRAADRLAASRPPREALREWMKLFVDHIAEKHLIAPVLNGMVCGPGPLYDRMGAVVTTAVERLAARAVASGELSADVAPLDLLRALVGVASAMPAPGWQESARRLVDVLIAGSSPGA